MRALAAAGARVVFTSRSLPAGEEVAAKLRKDPRVKVCLKQPTTSVAGSAA